MSQAKTPKPFLKKGTRQYLSNATVRSLNQKPKIVQFGEEEETIQETAPIKPKLNPAFKKQPKDQEDFKIQIKVNAKPPPKPKDNSNKNSFAEERKAKQNKNVNEQKNNTNQNSASKRKPALLEDYLTDPSPNNKKNLTKSSFSKEKPNARNSLQKQTVITTMAGMLKRQDEREESDDEDQTEVRGKAQSQSSINSSKQTFPNKVVKAVQPQVRKTDPAKRQQKQQKQNINFNSDSDSDDKPSPIINKFTQKQPTKISYKNNINLRDADQDQSAEEQQTGPSKVLQKYYKKQAQPSADPRVVASVKKMTIDDIPQQLKDQLLSNFITDKGAECQKKLNELDGAITKHKKEKQRYEEDNKQLMKQKAEFQKEMEVKTKQFEEKLKTENNKLTREKRYMKDQQTTGKADWKIKTEVQELKIQLQTSQNQKKKIKTDLSREIDRLRKKLQQQMSEKQSLKDQIRIIQMQKLKLRQVSKQQKQQVKFQQIKKINYWQGAPKSSFTTNFFNNDFTLISLPQQFYCIQNLQAYQYYQSKKQQECELVSQERDESGSKINRRYKNGKTEQEYINKVLKETFPVPFKFTIVHHVNGDIKIVLNQNIHIYYDSKNQITQFRIHSNKVIHHFHQLKQIQMKFTDPKLGTIHQLLKNGTLVRRINGDQVRLKRNEKGQIISS